MARKKEVRGTENAVEGQIKRSEVIAKESLNAKNTPTTTERRALSQDRSEKTGFQTSG